MTAPTTQQRMVVSVRIKCTALLLGVAVLFGGGGVGNGLGNMMVQLTALGVLAVDFQAVGKFGKSAPTPLRLLIGLSFALVLFQLIPLPPELWQALPRRDLLATAIELAGAEADTWMSLSIQRARTATAFVGMFTPLAAIILVATLEKPALGLVFKILAGVGIACVAVGSIQIATGNTWGVLYGPAFNGSVLYAFFANRNSAGIFFDLVFLAICVVPLPPRNLGWNIARTLAGAVAALAVVFTQSRSSSALLILALVFAVTRAIAQRDPGRGKAIASARFVIPLLLVGGIGVLAVSSVMYSGRAALTATRYENLDDSRPRIWEDASYTARSFLPLGSGMGTFDEVFQLDESLEYMMVPTAGRAHNDYIELLIEAGIPGIVLLTGWLFWIGMAAWRSRHSSQRWLGWASASGLLLIALQSLVDYPLRSQALLCVAGVLVGVLANLTMRDRLTSAPQKDAKG